MRLKWSTIGSWHESEILPSSLGSNIWLEFKRRKWKFYEYKNGYSLDPGVATLPLTQKQLWLNHLLEWASKKFVICYFIKEEHQHSQIIEGIESNLSTPNFVSELERIHLQMPTFKENFLKHGPLLYFPFLRRLSAIFLHSLSFALWKQI